MKTTFDVEKIIETLVRKRKDAIDQRSKAENKSDSMYLNGYLSAINDALRTVSPHFPII